MLVVVSTMPAIVMGQTGVATTFAGSGASGSADGIGMNAEFKFPYGVAASPDGANLFVGCSSRKIRQIVIATAAVTSIAGQGGSALVDGIGTHAKFMYPRGLVVSPDSTTIYVADTSAHAIRKVVIATGATTTLAGSTTSGYADGTGNAARFDKPYDVTVSPDGSLLYVTDLLNHRIRKLVIATGAVTTLAGSTSGYADGTVGTAAKFNFGHTATGPGLALSKDGTLLFVADHAAHLIRQVVTVTGATTWLAGAGGGGGHADGAKNVGKFNRPCGLSVSLDDRYLFVGDDHNHRVRQVLISTGEISTLAGSGVAGHADGTGAAAQFWRPTGVAVSMTENVLYMAGADSNRIRRVRAFNL